MELSKASKALIVYPAKVGAIRNQHLYVIYYVSTKRHKMSGLKFSKVQGAKDSGTVGN